MRRPSLGWMRWAGSRLSSPALPALPPNERRVIETEEAWILGLGHEALKGALASA